MSPFQLIGIVDGAVLAAATAVGQAYPPAAPVCQVIVEVCGVLSTVLATVGHINSKRVAS
jgi:hypothetical protein